MKVQNYNLTTSNGKHIRIATKVIFNNGEEIKFMERLSFKEAINQADLYIKRLRNSVDRLEKVVCEHINTIDLGDEEHQVITCIDCQKVL